MWGGGEVVPTKTHWSVLTVATDVPGGEVRPLSH